MGLTFECGEQTNKQGKSCQVAKSDEKNKIKQCKKALKGWRAVVLFQINWSGEGF